MAQQPNRPKENTQVIQQKKARPENKDNLDSRKNEEWNTRGDDVTHTRKERRSEKPGRH